MARTAAPSVSTDPAGGPAQTAPQSDEMFCCTARYASLPATEPRLWPYTTTFGVVGSAAARVATARTTAFADRRASSSANRKVAQLGLSEYCTATVATSPPNVLSAPVIAFSSTQPDPVGIATTTTLRSKAPARSISETASATRSSGVAADSSPTYVRTVSRSCPPDANARPSRPSA